VFRVAEFITFIKKLNYTMKVSLNIPDDLIKSILQITKAKTANEAIIKALQETLSQHTQQKLLKYRGKINLKLDLDTLRDRKKC